MPTPIRCQVRFLELQKIFWNFTAKFLILILRLQETFLCLYVGFKNVIYFQGCFAVKLHVRFMDYASPSFPSEFGGGAVLISKINLAKNVHH